MILKYWCENGYKSPHFYTFNMVEDYSFYVGNAWWHWGDQSRWHTGFNKLGDTFWPQKKIQPNTMFHQRSNINASKSYFNKDQTPVIRFISTWLKIKNKNWEAGDNGKTKHDNEASNCAQQLLHRSTIVKQKSKLVCREIWLLPIQMWSSTFNISNIKITEHW